MAIRSCVSMSISSNGGGLRGQKRETSADVGEFNGLPMTQSADLPVRPFGARPAEPAFATGAPPDAPGATPALRLLRLAGLGLLCIAGPVAAAQKAPSANHSRACCPKKHVAQGAAWVAPKAAPRPAITLSTGGGGGIGNWGRIAADLMP